jgi:hypothetical protein
LVTISDNGALVVIVACAVGLMGNTTLQVFALFVVIYTAVMSTLQW